MELTPRSKEMYAIIKEYLETEMTQIDFCNSKQIPESTFQYWLKRYRDDNNNHTVKSSFTNKKVRSNFIPLEITSPSNLSPIHCEIERPNGTIIKLKCNKVSADFLELLRIITA
jgi:adenylate kinase family enzyme